MGLTNNQIRDLNKTNRAMQNCLFGTLLAELESTIMTEGITASASALSDGVDLVTITLGEIIPTLLASDFIIKKNGVNMTLTTDYVIEDITTTTPDITFGALKVVGGDVITVTITKDEFLINGGNPIAVTNEKSLPVAVTSTAITDSNNVSEIAFDREVEGLEMSDVTVLIGGAPASLPVMITNITTTGFDATFDPLSVDPSEDITMMILKTGYIINGGIPVEITNSKTVIDIFVTSEAIQTATDAIVFGFNPSLLTLVAGDFVVNKDSVALTNSTDYEFTDLNTEFPTLTFKAPAGLDSESVVTLEITKTGYRFNAGVDFAIVNEIPIPITVSSSAITTATGMITLTLDSAVATLEDSDIVVNVDATPITLTEDYTIADVTTSTIDITFLAGAGLTNASVITVEITKLGYTFNSGVAVSVTNSIA